MPIITHFISLFSFLSFYIYPSINRDRSKVEVLHTQSNGGASNYFLLSYFIYGNSMIYHWVSSKFTIYHIKFVSLSKFGEFWCDRSISTNMIAPSFRFKKEGLSTVTARVCSNNYWWLVLYRGWFHGYYCKP